MLQPLVTKVRRRAGMPLGTAFSLALVAAVAFGAAEGGTAPVVKVRGVAPAVIVTEVRGHADDARTAAPPVAGRAPRVIVVQEGEMIDATALEVSPPKPAAKAVAKTSSRLRAKRLAEARLADSSVRVTVVGPDGKVATRILRIRR